MDESDSWEGSWKTPVVIQGTGSGNLDGAWETGGGGKGGEM